VTVVDPDHLAALEEERAYLLASLDDLEREHAAGDLDDDDYRQLADGTAALPPRPPRRWGRTLAVTAAVVALAVASGLLVARFSGQRLPGGTSSGDIDDSINTLLIEARSLQATDPKAALDRYGEVLGLEPDNTEALTYRGWMLVRVGADAVGRGVPGGEDLVTEGTAAFDRAIALRPDYADPHCFKAITMFRFYADAVAAKPAVDTCVASNPPQVVLSLVQNLQAEIDEALGAPSTTSG
jgi:catechol 2,3-dioxygenase-like lactoylglutathione lyase family enzyme